MAGVKTWAYILKNDTIALKISNLLVKVSALNPSASLPATNKRQITYRGFVSCPALCKHFPYSNSLKSHNNFAKKVLSRASFYRRRHRILRLHDLPNIPQIKIHGARGPETEVFCFSHRGTVRRSYCCQVASSGKAAWAHPKAAPAALPTLALRRPGARQKDPEKPCWGP